MFPGGKFTLQMLITQVGGDFRISRFIMCSLLCQSYLLIITYWCIHVWHSKLTLPAGNAWLGGKLALIPTCFLSLLWNYRHSLMHLKMYNWLEKLIQFYLLWMSRWFNFWTSKIIAFCSYFNSSSQSVTFIS